MRHAPTIFGVCFVVTACVGEDPNRAPAANTSSSDGSASDASTSPETSTSLLDGATDQESQDAATPTKSIVCEGTASCTGTSKCCAQGTDWGHTACKDDCAGSYELACDDAADCDGGKVCCFVTDGGARVVRSYCRTACAAEEQQLCNPSAEAECRQGTCTIVSAFAPGLIARCRPTGGDAG